MPHLEIEYTANLDGVDTRYVLNEAMGALNALGLYEMPTAKGRIRRLDDYAVDHPDNGRAFVSVVLSVLPGKSDEQMHETSSALTAAILKALPRRPGTQVRTEVRVMNPLAYTGFDMPGPGTT